MSPRILHVAAVDFTATKLLAPQLDALTARGYDVRVACGKTDSSHWAELARFDPIDIPFPREVKPIKMFHAAAMLSQTVRGWAPHILHLHTPAASLPIRALPHPSWPRETAIVYTVHGYLHGWPPTGVAERLIQTVEKWEARRTNALLFQSAEDYEASRILGYRSNLVLLGNGVEDAWFTIDQKPRGEEFQLLFVGRLVREKGVLELLAAVSQLSGVHLHIVGEALASDRDSVFTDVSRLLAKPALSGRVTMHGMLSRSSLQALYNDIDGLCLPSHREGVPRSVIEALASARPVVATNIRGCNELVKPGVNGWLVPVGEVSGLANALRALMSLNSDALAAMGVRARASVDPQRRESYVYERLAETYRSLGV